MISFLFLQVISQHSHRGFTCKSCLEFWPWGLPKIDIGYIRIGYIYIYWKGMKEGVVNVVRSCFWPFSWCNWVPKQWSFIWKMKLVLAPSSSYSPSSSPPPFLLSLSLKSIGRYYHHNDGGGILSNFISHQPSPLHMVPLTSWLEMDTHLATPTYYPMILY